MKTIWIGSPNYNKGRAGKKPIQIVIHWFGTAGSSLESTDKWFQRENGTSAHFGVEDRKIHQYVNTDDTAWAVGNLSRNRETISIEHSADVNRAASEETYQTSAQLIAYLSRKYDIPLDRNYIIGHREVKATQCPGTMDIDKLIRLAKEENQAMQPDFKQAYLKIAKDVYGDDYNENWNDAEKKVFLDKIYKKADDISKQNKEREAKIQQLEKRIKELENTPGTQPQTLEEVLALYGRMLDKRLPK